MQQVKKIIADSKYREKSGIESTNKIESIATNVCMCARVRKYTSKERQTEKGNAGI